MIGTTELVLIALLILILFGEETLSRVAKEAGKLKKEMDEVDRVKEEVEKEKTELLKGLSLRGRP
jgi:Sec-independent protein translocase protein TatA